MGKLKDALTQPLMKTESARSGILVVVGGYVVYMAYDMFRDIASGTADVSPVPAYLAAGALVLGGIGIVLYSLRRWYAAYKAEQAQAQEAAALEEELPEEPAE